MAFDEKAAAQRLVGKALELAKATDLRPLHIRANTLRDDALLALSQAVGCRAGALSRVLMYMGLDLAEHDEWVERLVEKPETRALIRDKRLELMEATEALIAEALQENCGCAWKSEPAPLIAP